MSTLNYEDLLDNNKYYSKNEIDNLYGSSFKGNLENTLVLKRSSDFESYQVENLKDEDIVTVSINGETKKISKKLVRDLVENEGSYQYLVSNFDNKLGLVARIAYIDNRNRCNFTKITRTEYVSALGKIYTYMDLRPRLHLALLDSMVTEVSMLNYYTNEGNKDYQVAINDEMVTIPSSTLADIFLKEKEKEFDDAINNPKIGYTKEQICYVIVQFIENERIFDKYILPTNIIERYKKLKNYEIVDFESLNKNRISNTEGNILEDTIIPEPLKSNIELLKKETYSPLEIAIYSYIDLSYTYSSYIKALENNNTKLTSKQFIYIFAKILDYLNIRYTLNQSVICDFESENKLTFNYGEYICSIDSSKEVLDENILSAKINDEFLSITSTNKCNISKEKFIELSNKIYNEYIIEKKKEIDYQKNLDKYRNNFGTIILDNIDRLKLFLKAISRKDIKGIDSIEYINNIFNNIFDNTSNINISYLIPRNILRETSITPIVIISIEGVNDCHYLKVDYKSNEILSNITKEEILRLLDSNYYCYKNNNILVNNLGEEHVRNYKK
jgi:hypothetical protein